MMEHPRLDTPGSLIRKGRESRGLSLPEMSELTKIPPPVLEAIERDEYHKVSGALYIKSFLRSCAVEVGLDPEEILVLYGSFSGETKPLTGGADMVWEEETVKISHVGLPWRNIGLIGGTLVLVGVAALLLGRGCNNSSSDVSAISPNVEVQAPDPVFDQKVSRADTLAGAWQDGQENGRPSEDLKAVSTSPVVEPKAAVTAVVKSEVADPEQKRESPVVGRTAAAMPLPLVGGPNLMFAGGKKDAVVLRIICDRPLRIQAKRDAEQTFQDAIWPAAGTAPTPLPMTGVEPGRVYGVSRGLVVYWGAEDHFSLRLDRTDGVEVAVNGKVRNIRNLRPGGEIILDDHQD